MYIPTVADPGELGGQHAPSTVHKIETIKASASAVSWGAKIAGAAAIDALLNQPNLQVSAL